MKITILRGKRLIWKKDILIKYKMNSRDEVVRFLKDLMVRDMMEYINIFGAIFMVIIMIPNIIYAIKNKDAFKNKWTNKTVEILEQVGRIGCFGFTVFNITGRSSDKVNASLT